MSPVDRQKARRNGVMSLESSAKERDLHMISGSQALLSWAILGFTRTVGCVCLGYMEMGEGRAS